MSNWVGYWRRTITEILSYSWVRRRCLRLRSCGLHHIADAGRDRRTASNRKRLCCCDAGNWNNIACPGRRFSPARCSCLHIKEKSADKQIMIRTRFQFENRWPTRRDGNRTEWSTLITSNWWPGWNCRWSVELWDGFFERGRGGRWPTCSSADRRRSWAISAPDNRPDRCRFRREWTAPLGGSDTSVQLEVFHSEIDNLLERYSYQPWTVHRCWEGIRVTFETNSIFFIYLLFPIKKNRWNHQLPGDRSTPPVPLSVPPQLGTGPAGGAGVNDSKNNQK